MTIFPCGVSKRAIQWLEEYSTDLEVEIGYGSSELLLQLANSRPDRLFVGVDINPGALVVATTRMRWYRGTNIEFLCEEADHFLTEHVPSSRICRFHVYFPTPVPWRNRLISPRFVGELYRCLSSGGDVRIVTDHGDYFEHINHCFEDRLWRFVKWGPLEAQLPSSALVGTPLERRLGGAYVLRALKL